MTGERLQSSDGFECTQEHQLGEFDVKCNRYCDQHSVPQCFGEVTINGLGKEEPSNGPYAFFRLFSGNPCPQQSWDLHISLNPALIHDPGRPGATLQRAPKVTGSLMRALRVWDVAWVSDGSFVRRIARAIRIGLDGSFAQR